MKATIIIQLIFYSFFLCLNLSFAVVPTDDDDRRQKISELCNLVVTKWRVQNIDSAHYYLDKAEKLVRAQDSGKTALRIIYLRGEVELYHQNYQKVIDYSKEGLRLEKSDSFRRSTFYYLLGSSYYGLNDYLTSFDYFNRALDIVKREENQVRAYASMQNYLANIYYKTELYDSAYALYKQSGHYSRRNRDTNNLAAALANQGNVLAKLGKYDEAIDKYSEAIAIYTNPLQSNYIDFHYEKLNLYIIINEVEKARLFLDTIKKIAKEADLETHTITALRAETEVLMAENDTTSALNKYAELVHAIVIADNPFAYENELYCKAYGLIKKPTVKKMVAQIVLPLMMERYDSTSYLAMRGMAEGYESLGQIDSAYKYLQLALKKKIISDSLRRVGFQAKTRLEQSLTEKKLVASTVNNEEIRISLGNYKKYLNIAIGVILFLLVATGAILSFRKLFNPWD